MTTNHTAPELLEAVGFDWHKDYALVQCPQCKNHRYYCVTGNQWHRFDCSRPDTSQIAPTYTGPEIGTPELDGILLVAGQKWLQDAAHSSKRDVAKNLRYDSFEQDSGGWISGRLGLMFQAPFPGHALARAIAELNHA